MTTVKSILEHSGVKGMKWGVRKKSSKEAPSHDFENFTSNRGRVKKSGTKALNNKELQDLITRMNLEQQYSSLTQKRSSISKGQQTVKSILDVGKTANDAFNVVNSPLFKAAVKSARR